MSKHTEEIKRDRQVLDVMRHSDHIQYPWHFPSFNFQQRNCSWRLWNTKKFNQLWQQLSIWPRMMKNLLIAISRSRYVIFSMHLEDHQLFISTLTIRHILWSSIKGCGQKLSTRGGIFMLHAQLFMQILMSCTHAVCMQVSGNEHESSNVFHWTTVRCTLVRRLASRRQRTQWLWKSAGKRLELWAGLPHP